MWRFGNLWAGSDATYDALPAIEASINAMVGSGVPEPQAELLSIESGVGIVNIEGALIPGNAGFFSYFGYVGYNDIRNATVAALMNPEVKSILFNISSPGGAVTGCEDCANLLEQVKALKPTMVFSADQLASGAYWLAAKTGKIFVGSTASVGSIGVIAKAAEYTKAREAAGITDLVVRSGPYKQLINAVEKHSALAVSVLQEQVDAVAAVFVEHAASGRGMSPESFDKTLGQGRVFVGSNAVQAGIADGLATYDGALSAAILMQPR